MAYIGLDVGTAGCKASVIDEGGNILFYSYREYSLESPQPGYVEIDARVVWDAVKQVLRKAAAEKLEVSALAIASFGEGVVLLDEKDEVIANSIFYSDIRGGEEIGDILKRFDAGQIQSVTGMPINPMYSSNKLLWIKKHRPEDYRRARRIMLFGDFISYMLTGEAAVDYSLASRTQLFDIGKEQWAESIAGPLGIDMGRFSKPVRAGTPVGRLAKEAVRETGLPKELLVVAGGHDQAMAALGAGAVYTGDSVDGVGSAECITLVLGKEDISGRMYEYNYCCEPFVLPGRYITLAFNSSSGTSMKWYRDCIEREKAAEYEREGKNLYRELDEACGREPSPVWFLPHVAGSGTPHMDAAMGGAFLGLRVSTTKAQMYRAVLEGVCYEMMLNVNLLAECGLDLKEVIAVGGGSVSDVLMQIKANIMNREIKTLASPESGTLGLGLLCGYATGAYPDIEKAAKELAAVKKTYVPEAEYAKQYSEKLAIYEKIYPALKTIF